MTTAKRPVIVSAPQGSEKTRLALELARMFGCTRVIDDWDGLSALPDGALVLTNRPWPAASEAAAGETQGAV